MTKLILSSAFVLLTLIGCKKDNDPGFPEENPLADYLAATGFTQKTTNVINSGDYEFGIKFTPKVKGTIKKIALKIPDNAASIRVTIWDVNTKTAVRTEILTSIVKDVEKVQEIPPLQLQAGLMYMITYNGNDWYHRQRTDAAPAPYPIKAGELSIEGYAYLSGASQEFPTVNNATYYGGDLSFVFQQAK